MRTTFILAAVAAAAAAIVQASASESRCTTCDIPQQTAYPNAANYAAAIKAANEAAAIAAAYGYGYGYSPASPTSAGGLGAGQPYAKAGTNKNVNAPANNVAPNNAAISAPPEELLGPFSGIAGAVESSVEASLLGKVTSLPASEASRLKSSIQSRESSILGIASLTGATAASATGSATPRASGKAEEKVGETADVKEKMGSAEGGKQDSGAGALRWGYGSIVAVILLSLFILFA